MGNTVVPEAPPLWVVSAMMDAGMPSRVEALSSRLSSLVL